MRDGECEFHARLIRKTEQAVLVTNRKNRDDPEDGTGRELWLPRSILGTTSIIPDPKHPTDYPVFRCTIPQWKVDQDNLDAFIKA